MARVLQAGVFGLVAWLFACSGDETGEPTPASGDGGGCVACRSLELTSAVEDVQLALADVRVADLDGDDTADVVATLDASTPDQPDESTLALLWGRADGAFSEPDLVDLPGKAGALRAADMNGDSVADVLVHVPSSGSWWVLLADGDGGFDPAREWAPAVIESAPYDSLGAGSQAVVMDVTGDGALDIISAPDAASPPPVPSPDDPDQPTSTAGLVVLVGAGDGELERAVAVVIDPDDPRWSSTRVDLLTLGDADADGEREVVVSADTAYFAMHPTRPESEIGLHEASEQLLYSLELEDGSLEQKEPPEPLPSGVIHVAVGDFDGEGTDDVRPLSPTPKDFVTADLDGDGADELVVMREKQMSVIRGGAGAGESNALTADGPGLLQTIVAGDLDGDQLPEIVSTYRVWRTVEQDARRRTLEAGGLWIRSPIVSP